MHVDLSHLQTLNQAKVEVNNSTSDQYLNFYFPIFTRNKLMLLRLTNI